ncbi:hypothetical protein B0H14DRAFT_686208 [Mycena olivaceomarginata]|nr:hypothetical protein B0H14DRAFT_686208 [Mycena olivaceomarginata]
MCTPLLSLCIKAGPTLLRKSFGTSARIHFHDSPLTTAHDPFYVFYAPRNQQHDDLLHSSRRGWRSAPHAFLLAHRLCGGSAPPVTVTTVTVTPVCSVPTASAIPTILTSSSVPPIVSVSSLLSSALVLPSAVVDPAVSSRLCSTSSCHQHRRRYRNVRRRHCDRCRRSCGFHQQWTHQHPSVHHFGHWPEWPDSGSRERFGSTGQRSGHRPSITCLPTPAHGLRLSLPESGHLFWDSRTRSTL